MTWIPLLLADTSPCLRLRVLRELLDKPENDIEALELLSLREEDAIIAPVLAAQGDDGAWTHGDLAWRGDKLRMTLLALMRLSFLGFGPEHPAVQRGAEYLFSLQQEDGSWQLPRVTDGLSTQKLNEDDYEGYTMVPLQTTLPLRALAMCGYSTDPRAERAYAWLIKQRLDDGTWPTGLAGGGTYGRVAGYRKMPHSRWGCRSNTTGVLLCLAHHPKRRHSDAARRALDLLLGRETKEAHTLGYEVTRLIGAEPTRGFMTFYAKFDLAMVLDLCWRIGASIEDERVANIVEFVKAQQGEYGLWDTPKPQASRWVTFALLNALTRLDTKTDWISAEPRTPFQTYPKKQRRF